jgi:hypothetical protein
MNGYTWKYYACFRLDFTYPLTFVKSRLYTFELVMNGSRLMTFAIGRNEKRLSTVSMMFLTGVQCIGRMVGAMWATMWRVGEELRSRGWVPAGFGYPRDERERVRTSVADMRSDLGKGAGTMARLFNFIIIIW